MRMFALVSAALTSTCLVLAGCDDPNAQAVQGTIHMAPGTERPIGGSDALFITARPAGVEGGPPLAVLKMVGVKLPATYRIGQEDVIQPGTWFRGKIEVRAVLRKSGFVGAPVKGDMDSPTVGPVEPGASGVDLELRPVP